MSIFKDSDSYYLTDAFHKIYILIKNKYYRYQNILKSLQLLKAIKLF